MVPLASSVPKTTAVAASSIAQLLRRKGSFFHNYGSSSVAQSGCHPHGALRLNTTTFVVDQKRTLSGVGQPNNMPGGVEESKRLAAEKAVNEHVKDGDVVGVGSGSTIVYAVQRLAQRVQEEKINVHCIPTSFQAKQLITEHKLNLSSLEIHPHCNVAIDGADEADKHLTLIKGGGGCLAQEKIVAAFSDYFVVVADSRKKSTQLGTSFKYIPVEVLPIAYKPIQALIKEKYGGEVVLRMAKAKAGPVVTDNSNFILDWTFDLMKLRASVSDSDDLSLWTKVNTDLCCMAGVVDTGLFVGMANIAYYGNVDGSVDCQSRP